MNMNMELSKLENEKILKLYKQTEEYIEFLEKERKKKSTEEK